ncbi:tyrosine-protein phosphatase [Bacillus sp. FJAT-22090]|uniref:tyrosine-protein phosphatase n=1 Tax=Bacillus sp. FJAT-22090 TaxID=1581038 RepID=UPI0011A7EF76|nr:CpsB/CapC family capsule biosynthesis tyrosine phosphatase [Bacillus sp. FJAT-22090]
MIVDMHNFILPVDAGPGNDEGAIALAKKAVSAGVTHIIANPHCKNKNSDDFQTWIKHLVKSINKKLVERDIPLTVLEGMEIQLHKNLLYDLEKNLLPLAESNKYVLIGFPKNSIPLFTQQVFYEMQLKGYIPIIAHPEQNIEFRKNPNTLYELVYRGALVQVNASSIIGAHGRAIKRFVRKLCRHNLIHFITTNTYYDEKVPFIQNSAYKIIQKKFSKELVDYFQANSAHIVTGTDFHTKEPVPF